MSALGFAWKRAWWTASYWWFGPVGSLFAALLIGLSGVPATFASIVPDGAMRSTFEALICVLVAYAMIFVFWFVSYPIHAAYETRGGFRAALKEKLGDFMGPFLFFAIGVSVLAVCSVVGLGWLTVQLLRGTSTFQMASTSPNTVGTADFFVLPPESRYKFKWDPINNTRFDVKSDDQKNPDFNSNPALLVRNKTNTVAYNVKVSWRVELAASAAELVKTGRLSHYSFIVEPTKLLIQNPVGGRSPTLSYYLDDNPRYTLPVVAKETELFLPAEIFAVAALYLINKMPDTVGETTEPFIARVSLDWETSEGKKRRDFRIRLTATNVKADKTSSAIVESILNFSVDEVVG